MKLVTLFLLFLSQHALSQIVPNPRFFHEQLTWRSDYRTVIQKLVGVKRFSPDESLTNPFHKKSSEAFLVSYIDTIFGKQAGVSLEFTKEDSSLRSISLTFLGIDPKTGKATSDAEQSLDALWDSLSTRWGSPSTDKRIPFFGKKREWLFSSTEVQLLRLSTGGSLLTVAYTERK
jgi:hypothetical protein